MALRHTLAERELSLQTADGLRLFAREWTAPDPVRGVVCVLHGLGDHGGCYEHLVASLVSNGFAVIALDQRGHGRSDGRRGHTPSYDALLDDVAVLVAQAHDEFPGVPVFLYGHSMGGGLAITYAIERRSPVAGVAVTSPWFALTNELALWKRVLGGLLEPLWPTVTFRAALEPGDGPSDAPTCPEDHLLHERISLRLLMGCRRRGSQAVAHAAALSVPTLVVHGKDDPVTDPRASQRFAANAPGKVMLVLLDGVGHTPYEEDVETVPRIARWLSGLAA